MRIPFVFIAFNGLNAATIQWDDNFPESEVSAWSKCIWTDLATRHGVTPFAWTYPHNLTVFSLRQIFKIVETWVMLASLTLSTTFRETRTTFIQCVRIMTKTQRLINCRGFDTAMDVSNLPIDHTLHFLQIHYGRTHTESGKNSTKAGQNKSNLSSQGLFLNFELEPTCFSIELIHHRPTPLISYHERSQFWKAPKRCSLRAFKKSADVKFKWPVRFNKLLIFLNISSLQWAQSWLYASRQLCKISNLGVTTFAISCSIRCLHNFDVSGTTMF